MDEIESLFEDYKSAHSLAIKNGDLSLAATLSEVFRKSLLIAAASRLEYRFRKEIESFYKKVTSENEYAVEFVRNKAIERQYHTWFAWDRANANSFYGLFGNSFRLIMQEREKQSPEMKASMINFVRLGHQRNLLAHNDYVTFAPDLSAEDVFKDYKSALDFVKEIKGQLTQE